MKASITAETLLPDLIATFPSTRTVFDRYGLRGCGGEFGPNEQVGWFARLHGVPLETLLSELNQAARQPSSKRAGAKVLI